MTVSPEWTLPPWAEVRDALARYDEARLRAGVTAMLAAGPPGPAFHTQLADAAGGWYGRAGWRAGNESFGSCWCHSPMVNLQPGDPSRVAPAVDWVAREVNAMVDCLRAFGAIFDAATRDPRRDPDAVADATDRILDEVIARTGCQESWYHYAGHGITWLCDALGVPRGSLDEVISRSVETVFTSWTAPPPGARRAAVREIGAAICATPRQAPDEESARVEGWLRPARPRLAEALAAVEGLSGAAAAEALVARGLLHESWLDPSRRSFAELDKKARPTTPRPTARDAKAYALLAADAEGAARAEALAGEVAHRLARYGLARAPSRVVWLLERDVPGYGYRRFDAHHAVIRALVDAAAALSGADQAQLDVDAWTRAARRLLPASRDPAELRERCIEAAAAVQVAVNAHASRLGYESAALAKLWSAARWWALLAAAGMRTPDRETLARLPGVMPGARELAKVVPEPTPLDALPDALAAIVSLCDTGYALQAVDTKRDAITLLIPKA